MRCICFRFRFNSIKTVWQSRPNAKHYIMIGVERKPRSAITQNSKTYVLKTKNQNVHYLRQCSDGSPNSLKFWVDECFSTENHGYRLLMLNIIKVLSTIGLKLTNPASVTTVVYKRRCSRLVRLANKYSIYFSMRVIPFDRV